jgi:hypothetical protein
MTNAYRALLATTCSLILIIAALFFATNVPSGTTSVSYDSATTSCTSGSLGYCNGPTPKAVTVAVKAPISAAVIPSRATAKLTARSLSARFVQRPRSAAAKVSATNRHVAAAGTTPKPTPVATTPTPAATTPTPAATTPTPAATTPTPAGSTGTAIANAYVTAYGWPDNTPAGCAVSNPVLHTCAGGVGTFADPITLAVGATGNNVLDYPAGTKFYIPNVRRYFIVEDECGDGPSPASVACHNLSQAPSGTSVWVDMWAGGDGSNNAAVLACEDTITANHTIIINPDANRVVVTGSLFNATTGTCTAQFGG